MAADRERRTYPTWVRLALVVLQVVGVMLGVALGNATYERWSEPDDGAAAATTTTVVPPVAEVPEDADPPG